MDYNLKATSEEALWTALIEAGVAELVERQELGERVEGQEPELVTVTVRQPKMGQNLDIIGEIWMPTGKMIETTMLDETVREVPEIAALDGFHANLRGGLSEEQIALLGAIIIAAPATPYRVWA